MNSIVMRRPTAVLAKDMREVDDLPFSFSSSMASSESITEAECAIEMHSGADPDAASMLVGAPVITGQEVIQRISGGLPGKAYRVSCKAIMSSGRVIVATGVMSVVNLYEGMP